MEVHVLAVTEILCLGLHGKYVGGRLARFSAANEPAFDKVSRIQITWCRLA